MQDGWSFTKDTGDFLKKIKNLGKIPEDDILVAADVVGLYPNIPHNLGLQSLRKRLNETGICKVPTEEIILIAETIFKNNYFEFNYKVCKQISGTAFGTRFSHLTIVFSWMKWNPVFLSTTIATTHLA